MKITKIIMKHMTPRNILFLFFNIIVFTIFYGPIKNLQELTFESELYSHIPLIPIVSAYLIYSSRKTLFQEVSYSFGKGVIPITVGIILYVTAVFQGDSLSKNDYLSLVIFAAIISWIGGFLLFYGSKTFKKAIFPLFFLILMAPIPSLLVEKFILFLQTASAEVSYWLFKLIRVPVYRDGFMFQLPNVTVEVAKQCSGIRSSIALIITGLLLGYFYLRSNFKRCILILLIFPIAILKNGIRILTLSLLGAYVDIRFLTNSPLHQKGGILFFILALSFLVPILWFLRRSEREAKK